METSITIMAAGGTLGGRLAATAFVFLHTYIISRPGLLTNDIFGLAENTDLSVTLSPLLI